VDDVDFLARVRDLLAEQLVMDDVVVTAVRPAGGRPWPRTEATFELVDLPSSWQRPTAGSAYLPLGEEWRYARGCEEPSDYALLLAREIESAVVRLIKPTPPVAALTPSVVTERWQWLLERLALHGPVRQLAPDRLVVTEDTASFTVFVTAEEWASIATPIELDADDPQDFGWHDPDENYLVFYEHDLVWSIRPELPPVRSGAELRRKIRAAQAEGRTNVGWFAHPPTTPESAHDHDVDAG
jgi:hypothetical protein